MFENGASDMKAAEKDTVMDTGLCRNRHADCYACYDDCLDKNYVMYDKNVGKPIDLERLRRNRMHLDILRVCRQAYIEANSVLWGSSLWSFTHSLAFSKFMEYRNAVQRREMKNMHLDLDMRYHWILDTWAYGWYSVLKKSVLVKFSALKVVHLDITGNQWVRDSDFIGGPRMLRSDLEFNMLADLWHLTPKTLTVTCMETANMNGSKMTLAKRQQMANNIRKKLVDFTKAPYAKDYLTYSPEASKER